MFFNNLKSNLLILEDLWVLYYTSKKKDYMHLNFLSVLRAASGGIIGHRAP